MTFTFTTNDINEAAMVLALFNGQNTLLENSIADKALETSTETPTETETSVTTDDLSARDIQGVIDALVDMPQDQLVTNFGSGNDKPYRVIKNVGLKRAKEILNAEPTDEYVDASVNDIMNAIQYIIKDVSVGGMSHDKMEDLFGVRTSKKLFKENSLDFIVDTLKENGLI